MLDRTSRDIGIRTVRAAVTGAYSKVPCGELVRVMFCKECVH